jgi:anti-anti-sigma factor
MAVLDLTALASNRALVSIVLESDFDAGAAERVAELLSGAIDVGYSLVMLDASSVELIDLDGLDGLVAAEAHARDQGVTLVLRSPAQCVLDLLDRTGLDDAVTIGVNG